MEASQFRPESVPQRAADETGAFTRSEYVNAMSHFYRGELGRMMVWRQRLDTTTNWAVGATSTLTAVGLSQPTMTHLVFMVNMLMAWMFLWIEGRRYRYYDAFSARVRKLEAHFIMPVMMQNRQLLQGDWKRVLGGDLLVPGFKISVWEAVGHRLAANYIALYVMILIAWTTKILLHYRPMESFADFYHAVGVGVIPAWFVLGVVFCFYAFLVALLIVTARQRGASGEVTGVARELKRWKI